MTLHPVLSERPERPEPQLALVPAAPAAPWSIAGFRFYVRVRTRFVLSVAAGLLWAGFSTWIAGSTSSAP